MGGFSFVCDYLSGVPVLARVAKCTPTINKVLTLLLRGVGGIDFHEDESVWPIIFFTPHPMRSN